PVTVTLVDQVFVDRTFECSTHATTRSHSGDAVISVRLRCGDECEAEHSDARAVGHRARRAVCTITDAHIEIDGAVSPLDLRYKAARLLVESAALTAATLAGQSVENL
ncbi:MAG: hypothetical protein ACRD03_00525, partial [Acidimicrobiales bacterium]